MAVRAAWRIRNRCRTRNPCAINYPEWLRFGRLLIKEAGRRVYGKDIAKSDFTARDVEEYIDCCIKEMKSGKTGSYKKKHNSEAPFMLFKDVIVK